MQPDYQAMPSKEIFALKEANALKITAIKKEIRGVYQKASRLDLQLLAPDEEDCYERVMDVVRQIRGIVENDRGMLYASLYTQDEKFELIAALLQSISESH
jgi:hypothetical protein